MRKDILCVQGYNNVYKVTNMYARINTLCKDTNMNATI